MLNNLHEGDAMESNETNNSMNSFETGELPTIPDRSDNSDIEDDVFWEDSTYDEIQDNHDEYLDVDTLDEGFEESVAFYDLFDYEPIVWEKDSEMHDYDDPFLSLRNDGMVALPDLGKFKKDIQKLISDEYNKYQSKLSGGELASQVIYSAMYFVINIAHGSGTVFDQLANETKAFLRQYNFQENSINCLIEGFRNQYISENPVDLDIRNEILKVSRDQSCRDKVSVLPLLCGTGKSTAITRLILRTVKRNEHVKNTTKEDLDITPELKSFYNGLLVVTDSKERLKSLWNGQNANISDNDNEYIHSHSNWVTIMTEENAQDAEEAQKKTPVLLITTQRYFSWTKEEIKKHLKWGKSYKRPLIIFDEMPYLNEVRDISIKTLNDIDSALWLGLDNYVKLKDKLWCIKQWEKFRDRFSGLLYNFERESEFWRENPIDRFYFESPFRTMTDDDDRFFKLINEHKNKIRKNYSQEYHDIWAVKTLMNTWGIFSHRDADTGAYENKITVFIDNREKLTGLGAKVIILDGTGKVSPIYGGQSYVKVHDEKNYLRSLSYLTIKLCDLGTSRYDFFKDRNSIAPHVKRYLIEDGNKLDEMYYFTYKNKRSKFGDSKHTAHFGDIKGKNEFRETKVITQVGLNSLQPPQYLAHVLARNEDLRLALVGKSREETQALLEQITQKAVYKEFAAKHVLADIDQCIFRSAIRNSGNTEAITYYLFYRQSSNRLLTKEIEERYKNELKANVLPIKNEDIETAWARQSDNPRERISIWVSEKWDGLPIKKKKVLEKLELKNNTFDSTIRRHFKDEFAQYKANAKAMGYPTGYYAKDVQDI